MTVLAALVLAAASARVESVSLTTVDSRLAVRVAVSGTPGMVAVHREGDVARVSIMDTELGVRFAGGRHFSWTPSDGFDPALLATTPARLDRLEIAAAPSEVSLLLHVPREASVDVRRDARGLLVVFRTTPTQPERVAETRAPEAVSPPVVQPQAAPPRPTEPDRPRVVATAPPEPEAGAVIPPTPSTAPEHSPVAVAQAPPPLPAPSADTLELAKKLFPSTTAGEQPPGAASVAELYPRLFPGGGIEPRPEPTAPAATVADTASPEPGVAVGPFRVRAGLDARYVDADSFVESPTNKVRDQYLEVAPHVTARAPVGEGRFTLEYMPVFRAGATYDEVNSSTQIASAGIDLPVGPNVTLRATDRFLSGVLDTRAADPGGEYFSGLGRFHRNDLDAGASIEIGPRLSAELAGMLGTVRFQEPSSFFDYDTRLVSAGLGFELTPNLKAVASYVYDTVPRPPERPQAEATSHSGVLSLTGEVLPLTTGQLSVGYRDQESPNAGEGGTRYSGLTTSGALTRQLRPESTLSVYVSRSTPVSAYGENAFYVSTALQGTLQVPLPLALQLRGGAGYYWNDYKTNDVELGVPRDDRILGWYVALRRPIWSHLFLAGSFRREERRSNVDRFDAEASGFVLSLEWDIFGAAPR